jgi:WD40-like Beta Propeller Repeat
MALVKRLLSNNMKKLSVIILIIIAAAGSTPGFAQGKDKVAVNRNSVIKVDPFRLEIVSPSSGIQFYKEGIVFLSHAGSNQKMLENHVSFGKVNAYYVTLEDTLRGDQIIFPASSSFEVPCEAMTFNRDYSLMFYTKKPSGKEQEKIYRATYQRLKSGRFEWVSDPKPLNFCIGTSVYSHPSVSAKGDLMVFSSNMSGSAGGYDLFITRSEGISWSIPENAGKLINTQGDEFSPFLDRENNLFFSSDGHPGSGGFDIYFCRFNGTGWDKPANLTDLVNSKNDEIAFKLNPDNGRSAFFTRKPASGKGTMQLLRVTFRDQVVLKELTNLSNAFEYLALGGVQPMQQAVAITTPPVTADTAASKTAPTASKTETQAGKKTVAETVKVPAKTQTSTKPAGTGQTVTKPAETKTAAESGAVVYRVQFASNTKPKGSYELTVGTTRYKTFEYLYNGAYRSCAGEFSTRIQAGALQKQLKQAGYTDAFIVAFKNNVRSLDPALFK